MKKKTIPFFASVLVSAMAATATPAAHASFYGDTAVANFSFLGSPVIAFGSSSIGAGNEFSGTFDFPFAWAKWAISVDVLSNGVTFNWIEAPNSYPYGTGNIYAPTAEAFSFDITFASTDLIGPGAITSFNSTSPYSSGIPTVRSLQVTGPRSLHIGFSEVYYGDTYTWTAQTAAIPEPATYLLFLTGLVLLLPTAKRRMAFGSI